MVEPSGDFVLILSCPDRPGIVHDVAGFLTKRAGNILESQQFGDQLTGRFFMRIDFEIPGPAMAEELRVEFAPVAAEYGMEYEMWDAKAPYRTLIMASKHLHCLNDLLFRWSTGTMQIEIPAVVSNHPDAKKLCDLYGLEFHHIPVTPDTKADAEARLMSLIREHGVHVVVLARYMQVLSDDLCRVMAGRIINIHHSFLPSFKGAKPYHQAHVRGVKIIGATAHYVTNDLDEGPIIEQDVDRVKHTHTPEEMVVMGRDVESRVLARAVSWHVQHRVMLDRTRTVVFD